MLQRVSARLSRGNAPHAVSDPAGVSSVDMVCEYPEIYMEPYKAHVRYSEGGKVFPKGLNQRRRSLGNEKLLKKFSMNGQGDKRVETYHGAASPRRFGEAESPAHPSNRGNEQTV